MNASRIALVVDSCTDVPPEDIDRYGMYVVPLQVNYEHESFLDKVTITPQECTIASLGKSPQRLRLLPPLRETCSSAWWPTGTIARLS